jgi:hypothetical protein
MIVIRGVFRFFRIFLIFRKVNIYNIIIVQISKITKILQRKARRLYSQPKDIGDSEESDSVSIGKRRRESAYRLNIMVCENNINS